MIRPVARALVRPSMSTKLHSPARIIGGRRFLSTDPPHLKSRSWKSSTLRWGLAAAGVYYYTTSPVFAEQPHHNLLNPNVDALEDETSSHTLDALTASSRSKAQKDASILQSAVETASETASQPEISTDIPNTDASPADLEEEAEGQGAFNPVTGEINWDCSCLGGMAYGPCGPEFREAFSCFVYSTEEPKGMECIDKFQNMQTCFRAHPEVYKGELEDDEELDAELAQEREELKNEIAERKAAQREQESSSGNRLLEVSGTASAKKNKSSSKSAPKSSSKVENSTESQSQSSARRASSTEPQPGMSDEHEAVNDGQRPASKTSVKSKPVDGKSEVQEGALLPKAAYDASDAPAPSIDKS